MFRNVECVALYASLYWHHRLSRVEIYILVYFRALESKTTTVLGRLCQHLSICALFQGDE